jgi:hypothetical protein
MLVLSWLWRRREQQQQQQQRNFGTGSHVASMNCEDQKIVRAAERGCACTCAMYMYRGDDIKAQYSTDAVLPPPSLYAKVC